jgi:hypothetical protein
MSHDNWGDIVAPKVQGTINLHEALAGADLDVFIGTSSTSGILEMVKQTRPQVTTSSTLSPVTGSPTASGILLWFCPWSKASALSPRGPDS